MTDDDECPSCGEWIAEEPGPNPEPDDMDVAHSWQEDQL